MERQYTFGQGDVMRLVTVLLDGESLTVTTRFATDAVQQADASGFVNVTDFSSEEQPGGVLLTWRSPLFGRRGWPLIRHRRRF